jgi:signal transduction histidine kinase
MTGGARLRAASAGERMSSPARPAQGLSRTVSRAPQLRARLTERDKWLPGSLAAGSARDVRRWVVPIGVVLIIGGVGGGAFGQGPRAGPTLVFTISVLILAAACWAIGLSPRFGDLRVVIPALIVLGLCGAALDWPQSDGPGFVAGYMALAGLALRVPRGTALLSSVPIVAAIAASEAHEAEKPASTVLAVALGCGFLFVTSALAALSQDAHHRAEALLAQESAIREAREQMARLAERARLARELHDVLAYSLSGLSLQLEGARLRASQTGADPALLEQISYARQVAGDGMVSAQRALRALRADGDEVPGLGGLPRLVSGTAVAVGIPIDFRVEGTPRPLRPEAELTAYRTVQEALTNVAKHAGRGARAQVLLRWAPDSLDISVADSGGDGVGAGLVSSGLGLTSMAERAALYGGQLAAGSSANGFTVQLRLPLGPWPRMVRS